MKSLLVRLTAVLLTVAFASSVVLAKKRDNPAKKSWSAFESSFAFDNPWNSRKKSRNWWGGYDDGVRIIYGSRLYAPWFRRIPRGNDGDPEADSGYGTGNLTYAADKLVPLSGTSIKKPRPADPAAAALYDALTAKDLGIRILPEIRQAMLDHYRARGFHPLWIDQGKVAARSSAVLKVLASAAEEGMQPANFLPPALSDFAAVERLGESGLAELARFDLGLTAMSLKYARDVSGGQFDPRRLSRYNDITPERGSTPHDLNMLAWSPYPDLYLRELQPKHPAYGAMRAELAKLRKEMSETAFVPIATGQRVKLGQTDSRIPAVRVRLASLDRSATPVADDADDMLDSDLSGALKEFQKTAGIKATGRLDNSTVKALNNHGDVRNLRRLANNMERMRWLPKQLGSRHVFVNPAAFQVQVMEGQSEIWRSKIIVGKPNTQTAAFHDEIETVVFNPSWGVPPSIVANEYLPKLWSDPSYLDRIGFKVTTASGRQVASSDIDWWAYERKVPFNIQQPPGADNALGELKFLFPNTHNIYMHDTPTKNLFAKDVMTFSHGCIRVENPREFATILLGWARSKVDANTESGNSQTVPLASKVPVHITYFTAWPDETGKIQYFNDIYGRDAAMDKAVSTTLLAQR